MCCCLDPASRKLTWLLCYAACLPVCLCACLSCTQHGGLSRKERMMRQLGLKDLTAEELAQEVQQLQDDWDDDD